MRRIAGWILLLGLLTLALGFVVGLSAGGASLQATGLLVGGLGIEAVGLLVMRFAHREARYRSERVVVARRVRKPGP